MIVLNAREINKAYGTTEILTSAQLTLRQGDRVGLIGANGSGKTTFINIITGETPKDSGDIYVQRFSKIGYLEQVIENSEITVYSFVEKVFDHVRELERQMRSLEKQMAENTDPSILKRYAAVQEKYEKQDAYSINSWITGVLQGLSLPEDKLMSDLSGGERSRAGIARLLLQNPDILVLDEPTNHLDMDAINWLEKYLDAYRGSIIIVSHDRYFLDKICNRITLIEGQTTQSFKGNYTAAMQQKQQEYEAQLKAYEIQSKEIKRQEAIIREFYSRATEIQIKKALSRKKLLAKVERIEKPTEESGHFNLKLETGYQGGTEVLHAREIEKSFPDRSGSGFVKILDNLNLSVYRGDKIGLIGENGIGKSTLIKILAGLDKADSGSVKLGTRVNVGYFSQTQENLTPTKTIIEEIHDYRPKLTISEVRGLLGSYNFKEDTDRTIDSLSGGERSRIAILKLMLSPANLLLLDEPTNHLDIETKMILENSLINYTGSFIAVSHDRYFLNRVCNKIAHQEKSGITMHTGTYSDYEERSERMHAQQLLENTKKAANQLKHGQLDKDSLTPKQQREIRKIEREKMLEERRLERHKKSLEEQIGKHEQTIADLEAKLCSPEYFVDYERANELSQQIEELKEKPNPST